MPCSNCRYIRLQLDNGGQGTAGICCFNPPTADFQWPHVNSTDWCSKFQQMRGPRPYDEVINEMFMRIDYLKVNAERLDELFADRDKCLNTAK